MIFCTYITHSLDINDDKSTKKEQIKVCEVFRDANDL